MPLYDYRCKSCQETTEVRHGFGETFAGPCPACGGEVARVFNAAGIVFKGSGFYINDSRAASSSSGSKSSGSGDSAKSEAAKSDAGGSDKSGSGDSGSSTPAPAASAPAASTGDSGSKKSDTAA